MKVIVASIPGGWPDDAPPRSACFSLAPEGESGESYEDLVSYFRRLSAFHGITPRSFATRTIATLIHGPKPPRRNFDTDIFAINGLTEVAETWVEALEMITLRTDLAVRTLLPLRNIVSKWSLLSKYERFCPRCYCDDESMGRSKYNRLLWSIACVNACPIHNVLLETTPSSSCPTTLRQYAFWLPGLSRFDGSSLASQKAKRASKEDIQTAILIRDLLDDVHQRPDVFETEGSSAAFLCRARDEFFDGKITHLAREIDIPFTQFPLWVSGEESISLPLLVRVAKYFACTLSDVILNREITHDERGDCGTDRRKKANRSRDTVSKWSSEMETEIQRLDKLGLLKNAREAALLLHISYPTLRHHAPDFVSRLVRRGREIKRSEATRRKEARFDLYWREFQELWLTLGRRPTAKLVASRAKTYWRELRGFHKRASILADQLERKHRKGTHKTEAAEKTINSCRKRH